MKTDSLFYRLFLEAPAILLQLGGLPQDVAIQEAARYKFRSVELKQTAFRLDGVLLPLPQEDNTDTELDGVDSDVLGHDRPVWFTEVQFQPDELLYHRIFSELMLFIRQNSTLADWRFVIIFPKRSIEPKRSNLHRELLHSDRVFRVFLEDLPPIVNLSLDLALIRLITEPQSRAIESAKLLIDRAQYEPSAVLSPAALLDLIRTIIVYKFEKLSREEIETMLGIADLKETRVYQEAREEGREEGREKGREEGQKLDRQALLQPLLQNIFGDFNQSFDQSLEEAIVSLIELPPNRFLSLLLALSQPPENRINAIVSVLQARFQEVPESVVKTLSNLEEVSLLNYLKKAISSSDLINFLEELNPTHN